MSTESDLDAKTTTDGYATASCRLTEMSRGGG